MKSKKSKKRNGLGGVENELNRDTIIKALECCTSSRCKECAYFLGNGRCKSRQMQKDAVALIKELTEKVDDLEMKLEVAEMNIGNAREGWQDAEEKVKELTEENERLKSVEFTCGFIKPHKVLECPIFDEIGRTKADTVCKMQDSIALHFGTYTDKDTVKVVEVFKLLERVGREILEGDKGK